MVRDTAPQISLLGRKWWILAARSTAHGTARIPTGCTTVTGAIISPTMCMLAPVAIVARPRSQRGLRTRFQIWPKPIERFSADLSTDRLTARCWIVDPPANRNEATTTMAMASGMF